MSELYDTPVTGGANTAVLDRQIKTAKKYLIRSRKWVLFADILLLAAIGVVTSQIINGTGIPIADAIFVLTVALWIVRVKDFRKEQRLYTELCDRRNCSK